MTLPTSTIANEPTPRPRGGSGAMFDRIAGRYDLLNRLTSMGSDRRWRECLVRALELAPGHRVLDLATGTADVALEVLRQQPDATVVGLDPSTQMLDHGRAKIHRAQLDGAITLQRGIAERLPFDDQTFDSLAMAFGIRNVPDRPAALREMARVVKPGGRIAILELGEPQRGFVAPFARFYIHQVVPRLGALLSGAKEYTYLERSIASFPPAETFAELMRGCDLRVHSVRPLMMGACTLFLAEPADATSSAALDEVIA